MRERNRCMHRQYQNVGHNGGAIRHFHQIQIPGVTLTRNDKPYIGFANFMGNDVCKKNLNQMLTISEHKENLLKSLNDLNKISPPNSKLLIMGLVDGRVLWNLNSEREHPLKVKYKNVYAFLTCNDANPCQTWLTLNETIRNQCSFRAEELSNTTEKIVKEHKFENIELAYAPFNLTKGYEECRRRGVPYHNLIEEVDGFHQSQFGHEIQSIVLFREMLQNNPSWIGEINPFNNEIERLFKNQGGH